MTQRPTKPDPHFYRGRIGVAVALGIGLIPVSPAAAQTPTKDLGFASVNPALANDGRLVALVVGNGDYEYAGDLAQAPTDAEEVAKTLQGLGYEVDLVVNADHRQFSRAVADYSVALAGSSVGFFYYSGHGVQVDGINYMVPVDAEMSSPAYADSDAIDARKVLKAMDQAGSTLNVVVLDACRNNPWASKWFTSDKSLQSRGLAQMDVPSGFVVAYSTGPGDVAADESGYASTLQTQLKTPCLDIVDVFLEVHSQVKSDSGGVQVPWVNLAVGAAARRYHPAGGDGCGSLRTVEVPYPGQVWSSPSGAAFRWGARGDLHHGLVGQGEGPLSR